MRQTDTATAGIVELQDKWAEVALSSGWVEDWVEGAIFPREMVFFLACCQEAGVERIIESGRQDGYSTKILAEYAHRQGIQVYSIDHELDAVRAEKCRERLALYPALKLLKGDATDLLGRVVRAEPASPCAVICDGPKSFRALSLLFASAGQKSVKLFALHNLAQGSEERLFLETQVHGPIFYEDFGQISAGYWEKLMASEVRFCSDEGANRSLVHSTLGVVSLSNSLRRSMGYQFHWRFKFYQPLFVRIGWKLGLYGLTSLLFTLPHRLFALLSGQVNGK